MKNSPEGITIYQIDPIPLGRTPTSLMENIDDVIPTVQGDIE